MPENSSNRVQNAEMKMNKSKSAEKKSNNNFQRQPTETMNQDSFYERERTLVQMKRQCGNLWRNFNEFMVDSKTYETFTNVAQYLMSHPMLLAACLAVLTAIAVPLLVFILFAIVNVAFAFVSFVIIEVTVLTIGATVLCFMLFCVISTITVVGLFLVLTYYIVYYVLSSVRNIKASSN